MAQLILTNAKVLADKYDVSAFCNQASFPKSVDIHDVTPFGATSRRSAPGLQSGTFQLQGFTEFGANKIEAIMDDLAGDQDKPLTIIPEGATVGNVALFMAASFHGYEFGGPHGNPNTFTWSGGTSKWQIPSGYLEEPGAVARVASGNSAGKQLGAVSASQYLYAAVHIIGTPTGTMDLIVEGDTTGAFTGPPTTRITFPQFTSTGGASIMRTAGPITDTYYRFKWTLATTPSFTFFAVFGIDV